MPEVAAVRMQMRPDRVICVLGMHRSGTSCLAGSLEQQGLYLGDVNTSAPWNRRGNRESFAMMDLHTAILEANGGSWEVPPATVAWETEHIEQGRAMLAEQAERTVWGFKDPCTLLTYEGWRRLVPDLQPVGIFRHPLKVARSLKRRNDLDIDAGLALWRSYNERFVRLHREAPFPIVSFDEETGELERKLRQAGELLGLPGAPEGEPFFTDELRNAPAAGGTLPADVERLHEELLALAL
jgi:hypothetical protein